MAHGSAVPGPFEFRFISTNLLFGNAPNNNNNDQNNHNDKNNNHDKNNNNDNDNDNNNDDDDDDVSVYRYVQGLFKEPLVAILAQVPCCYLL